jgi:hypothetical protein
MMKKRGKKIFKFNLKIIIPLIVLALLFLIIFFLTPLFNQSGKAVINVKSPIPIAPASTTSPSSSEVKTVSIGIPTSINGVSFILTNLINNLSSISSFVTFIVGNEININNGSSSSVNLDWISYTVKVVSLSDRNVSIMLSNSFAKSDVTQIPKNKFLQFNFTNSSKIHIGDYFLINNGTYDYIFKTQNAGVFINANCNMSREYCYIAQFSEITKGGNINVSWNGYITNTNNQQIRGGVLTADYKYLLVLVQGSSLLNPSLYNISVQQYPAFDRYPFSPSYNILYSRSNLPSVFVKNISTSSASLIAGHEMFLNLENNKETTISINGKNYTIELKSITSSNATFNISFVSSAQKGLSTSVRPSTGSSPTCVQRGGICSNAASCCSRICTLTWSWSTWKFSSNCR